MNDHQNHKILLAVAGLSPQIVTETVYALAVERETPWIPDEVHVITTSEGAERARLSLLEDGEDWFGRLRRDYQLPAIRFGREQIHVIRDANAEPLDDIRTPDDNERVADFITEMVRNLTADENSELHVSIAGGRKTMGYYLGYALTLFGRLQDRLSHVLVSPLFEGHPMFFYPTPESHIIYTNDNKPLDTSTAKITLANIPFVRLREELPGKVYDKTTRATFSEIISALQKAQQPLGLVIDMENRRISCSNEPVDMDRTDLAFYAMFARNRKEGREAVRFDSDGLSERYLDEYAKLVSKFSGDYEKAEKRLQNEYLKDWFDERKSKTNKALEKALPVSLAKRYQITSKGKRPKTLFEITLPPEAIEFADGKLAKAENSGGAR